MKRRNILQMLGVAPLFSFFRTQNKEFFDGTEIIRLYPKNAKLTCHEGTKAIANFVYPGSKSCLSIFLAEEKITEKDLLNGSRNLNTGYKYVHIIRYKNLVGYCWCNDIFKEEV
jgi:hypothetical protein